MHYAPTHVARRIFAARRTRDLVVILLCGITVQFGVACSDPTIESPAPNVCTTTTCPQGWCKLTLQFAPDCQGLVQRAEILLGQSLEPEDAIFGQSFTSVGDVPAGTTEQFWVRSDDWQWQVELVCADPNRDGDFTLSCSSALAVP